MDTTKSRLSHISTDIQAILLSSDLSREVATRFMQLNAEKTRLLEEMATEPEPEQDLDPEQAPVAPLPARLPQGTGESLTVQYGPQDTSEWTLQDLHTHLPTLAHALRRQARGPGLDGRRASELFGQPGALGWKHTSEFFMAVAQKTYSPALVPFRAAMGEGAGSAGGFLVPAPIAFMLLDEALNKEIVRPRATVIPMTSHTITIPAYDGIDQSGVGTSGVNAMLYGFTWQWLAEGQTATVGTGKVRGILLTANVGATYVAVSNELMTDAPNFEADLSGRIIASIAQNLDAYFLTGDGVGKPLGVTKSPALLVVAKEAGQAADSIVWGNIVKMVAAHSNYTNAVWVVSPSMMANLGGLTIAGTGLLPALSNDGQGHMSLLGRPLFSNALLPVIGDQGDIGLYDFSAYFIGLRKDVGIEASAHVGWLQREQNFRAVVRVDGQPKLNRHYVGPDGQDYSPFVALAVRA